MKKLISPHAPRSPALLSAPSPTSSFRANLERQIDRLVLFELDLRPARHFRRELLERLVPAHECELRSGWHVLDLEFALGIRDRGVGMIKRHCEAVHPLVD